MALGNEYLHLTDEGTWDSFPKFAEELASQIGASIIKRKTLPDSHLWEIEFEGDLLRFVYDDFPNGISIEPKGIFNKKSIQRLYELISSQGSNDGI